MCTRRSLHAGYQAKPILDLPTSESNTNCFLCLWNISVFTAVVSGHQEQSKAADFAHENQQAIRGKFADFQTNVCTKLLKSGVDIEEFQLFVTNQFPPGDFIPASPTSLTEVFKAITNHGLWDYLHYTPLVQIAKRFGASDPEIEGWVQTYKKDLKAHSIVTTVEEYIETDFDVANTPPPPAKRAKYDPRYCTSVEWKTEFLDHSLQYLAEVWELFSSRYLMPDSPPTALLDRVCEGCLSVTWLVPSHLIESLTKRVEIDTDFFHQHHILRVTVGDKCIYEEITEKGTAVLVSSFWSREALMVLSNFVDIKAFLDVLVGGRLERGLFPEVSHGLGYMNQICASSYILASNTPTACSCSSFQAL